MSRIIAYARRLFADRRGTMYVEYTSLLLLVAIAAIAVLANHGGVPN
jgi:Flp pilus assembly pilin Flp